MSEFGEKLGDTIITIIKIIAGLFGMFTFTTGMFVMIFLIPYALLGLTVSGVILGIVFGFLVCYGLLVITSDDDW